MHMDDVWRSGVVAVALVRQRSSVRGGVSVGASMWCAVFGRGCCVRCVQGFCGVQGWARHRTSGDLIVVSEHVAAAVCLQQPVL
jgi:hypothetical protein